MINQLNIFRLQVLLLILTICIACPNSKLSEFDELKSGFIRHDAKETGVDFNNQIIENDSINHLFQMQIYNGAGVAIGDINNDDLPDIFFAGNQVDDRLYLNKGNFQFEDISKSANINQINGWSAGVTMVDINADGLLDIYVSRSGLSMKLKDRQNMLYINNGDLTFTESSKEYGLENYGCSSQSVFFDMDNDNDLDMFQMNQPPDPRIADRFGIEPLKIKFYTDKLYKNEGGFYVDVSKELGVDRLAYGLGLTVSDFNRDGYMDIYVANDYDVPDFYYQNNGDGTFTNRIDQTFNHISRFGMGSDAGDINNDGLTDLMVLDMAAADHYRSKTNMGAMNPKEFEAIVRFGGHHQYMFNTLQLNNGMGMFSEIGQFAGISKTDWSWAPLIMDYDNDGWKDIYVTNGIVRDIRNNDYVDYVTKSLHGGETNYLDLALKAPSVPIGNHMYRNNQSLKFSEVATQWGLDEPAFSTGAAYADLDQDGDLDLVTNNTNSSAFVYENLANGNYIQLDFQGPPKNPLGYGVQINAFYQKQKQVCEHIPTRGYLSSVEPGIHLGLGTNRIIDSIQVYWPDGNLQVLKNIKANKKLTLNYFNSSKRIEMMDNDNSDRIFEEIKPIDYGIDFIHEEEEYDDFKEQVLLPYKLSQNGPFISVADVNSDGLDDFFVGGAAGQSGQLYIQHSGKFSRTLEQPWIKNLQSEDAGSAFFDIDDDGDMDLYVCNGSNEFSNNSPFQRDHFYLNNGDGTFVAADNRIPKMIGHNQIVRPKDIDLDGDMDLYVGGRLVNGHYPFPADSYILINENGYLKEYTEAIAPELKKIGLVSDADFCDIDDDGDSDLILVGEWMPITVFENTNGRFVKSAKFSLLSNLYGKWWSLSIADIDADGDVDLVVGNLGENTKFKATETNPFVVYSGDIDANGSHDVILSQSHDGRYLPIRGRECMSHQLPFIDEKFKDYHSYALSTLGEILPDITSQNILKKKITLFSSIILLNNQGDGFSVIKLPEMAQLSPIKSSIVRDFNGDGIVDILAFGNHYPTEVETIRYDAGRGLLLLGNGQGYFSSMKGFNSGVNLNSDHRHSRLIEINNQLYVMVTNNNGALSLLRFSG